MRESEFWNAVDWVFPGGHGRSLTQDLVLSSLGDLSPAQAIQGGMSPQFVWQEMCACLDLPAEYQFIHRINADERDSLRR